MGKQESLDQKLRSILESFHHDLTTEEAITAIKQAVAEELPDDNKQIAWSECENNEYLYGWNNGFNGCLSEIKLKLGVK